MGRGLVSRVDNFISFGDLLSYVYNVTGSTNFVVGSVIVNDRLGSDGFVSLVIGDILGRAVLGIYFDSVGYIFRNNQVDGPYRMFWQLLGISLEIRNLVVFGSGDAFSNIVGVLVTVVGIWFVSLLLVVFKHTWLGMLGLDLLCIFSRDIA